MPLEDLTGNKFIPDLNENWPAGTDYPDAGDDHIRGVKNVLKRQFPNIGRVAVTATAAQLNSGGVPIGSVMIFYQTAPPTGWKRSTIDATRALRVVATATAGGGSGGLDDPVLNDKVPSHAHAINLTSGAMNANAQHTHVASASAVGDHVHFVAWNGQRTDAAANGGAASFNAIGGSVNSGAAGAHGHTISVVSTNTDHSHNVVGDSQSNASAANWAPRYMDVIVCERET
jgi:hypothetical protein